MVSRERWANSERSMAALLGYKVVPRNESRLRQRISAQSQPRFCTPISRPGLPCPRDPGPSPQGPLSAVRRLEIVQVDHQSFRSAFGYPGLSTTSGLPPSAPTACDPLTQGRPNPLRDDIMNLAPFAKGRLAEPLLQCLRQVNAGVNYARPPFSASGPCWLAARAGWGSGVLGHENRSCRLPAGDEAVADDGVSGVGMKKVI
jgi:hypothetical protein